MNLKNKTVLVTGASKGIGEAIAYAFAREGSNVIINYRSSEKDALNVLKRIDKFKGKNCVIQADMGNVSEVKEMFNVIKDKYKRIDILVNNAGDAKSTDLGNDELDTWEYQLRNNFLSAVIASKEFLNLKGNDDIRKIINISSIWGELDKCHKEYMAYGASKASLNSFTKTMSKIYAPNVLINAISPGYVLTPHWGEMDKEEIEEWGNQQLINRFVDRDEIAKGVIFLCQNDGITGEILLIDGGVGLKTI